MLHQLNCVLNNNLNFSLHKFSTTIFLNEVYEKVVYFILLRKKNKKENGNITTYVCICKLYQMKEKISDEKEEIAYLNNKIEKLDRMLEDKTTVSKFVVVFYLSNYLHKI